MERILIIKLGALGDIVRTEGVLHDIRNHHGRARITVMTTPAYEFIFKRCPWIDDIFLDPRDSRWSPGKMMQLGKRLRQHPWDLVYDLQNVSRTTFYRLLFFRGVKWSGADLWLQGFKRAAERRSPLAWAAEQLKQAGVPLRHTLHPDLSWLADDVSELLAGAGVKGRFIVLIPGCSAGHPEKRWPYYKELAAMLTAEGRQVVTLLGPDEEEMHDSFPGIVLTKPGEYLDLFQLSGVLQQADFVIGNDTGPSHIASHLGRPGLVLFSDHAPAYMTDIELGGLKAIECPDLRDISVLDIYQKIPRW